MGGGPLGHVTKGFSAHGGLVSYLNAAGGSGLHEGSGASQGRLGPETPRLGNLGCPQDQLRHGEWAGSPGGSFCGPGAAETPRSLLLEGDVSSSAQPQWGRAWRGLSRLGLGAQSCSCSLEAAGGGVGAGGWLVSHPRLDLISTPDVCGGSSSRLLAVWFCTVWQGWA